MMKNTLSIALLAGTLLLSADSADARQSRAKQDDIILHAWSWSFDTIASRMKDIAEAGYTMVQTSPANTCYVGEGGGKALFSQPGDEETGKWYYYYQPTDWKVGNYLLGTRDDFKQLGDSALKYGVRLIVDVLPNHTAMDTTAVLPDFINAVGGRDNLLHANGMIPIRQWDDRLECTTGQMGGLPDVNTENPDFQYYYMQYVNDLINLGARGFRYDTAKHIGLPSDPLDPASEVNNFWPVAVGQEAAKGLSLLMPDSLFIYGEVLQGRNTKEKEYAEFIDLTASSYGHVLCEILAAGNTGAADLFTWHHPADPTQLVSWVESHDTYCNAHETAGLTDEQIRSAWVFLVSRAAATPLFYSRPAGSTRENYWGNNRVGDAGNDEYHHPAVVAANYFRRDMVGEPEQLTVSKDGAIAAVNRGQAGAAVVNFSSKKAKVDVETTLPNGEYTDEVTGAAFKVKNGKLTGELPANGTAILYAE